MDPLSINLSKQTRALLDVLPSGSPYSSQISLASEPKDLLSTLSRLLAVPSLTKPVSDLFRPLLIDLCARWLHDQEDLENRFVAFCMLIEIHEELFPILSTFLRRPCFSQGPLGFIEETPSIAVLDVMRLHNLLLAYYRLLRANRLLPNDLLWPISHLSTLFTVPHPDPAVKYLAIRCYSLYIGMAEVERVRLETQVLGEPGVDECPLSYGQNIDESRITVDGWLMPVLEHERVYQGRNSVAVGSDFYSLEDYTARPLTSNDLSPWTISIHGILMLKSSPSSSPPVSLVATPSAIKALRQLALLTSLRLPTLITSTPSSGKSLLLLQLASLLYPETRNQLVTVQLADTSLDPRALLGSYVSSPKQLGAFEWKDGVLVRAMREGKWLVFKDIDRASTEVLGLIKPLVESLAPGTWIGCRASIDVPNRGRVKASERFAVFATRSVAPSTSGNFPSTTFYGAHKFQELIVDAPSLDEVRMIVQSQFPKLGASLAQAIIQIWSDIQSLGSTVSSRPVGLRELEKYCRRVEALIPSSPHPINVETPSHEPVAIATHFPNTALREELFLEARDVFFGAGALTAPAQAHSDRVAGLIGDRLGIDLERHCWVLNKRLPVFEEERDGNGDIIAVGIGRVRLLARAPKLSSFLISPTRPFAVHKPAVCLLSRIATAISLREPVLLTGETGTGKTSAITHLASLLRRSLISLNLSHQTESSDLLGGFKPIDARVPALKLHEEFLKLFGNTFSRKKNIKFEESVRKAVREGKWRRAVALWRESVRLAKERIEAKFSEDIQKSGQPTEANAPRKRRKVDQALLQLSVDAWDKFQHDVDDFDIQHAQGQSKFAFDFVEGPLVKALRFGEWILLDEINLASPETLECITGLLSGPTASISLTEKGSLETIPRHPDFRLFACMNPATDVGKKDLPPNIRTRFTEIDVPAPDADRETLLSIIQQYIGPCAVGDKAAIMNVADFYSAMKELVDDRRLADGSNHRPHYSIRTLARALTFASDISPMYGLRRALWEGCLMAFTMVLDGPSADIATSLAHKHILSGIRNVKSLLTKEPSHPLSRGADEFIKFGPFYLEKGPLDVDSAEDYIMTPSVEKKLIDLARIVLTRRFPVLIEGPTSSGKTSAVEYLARRTGHQFIRINNHEHTDIQEYIGSYVSNPTTGKLVFKDGLLVHALRRGHWIVLDELNLAPTDVLEALNRLLDDNRELVIPETQEVVRPHPHFMLFATQNPPGIYAGRKVLSRAFRNRFLEVHFQDVPQVELESILCQRCRIAPSYGQRIVSVFRELQKRRQTGRVFESNEGFATLRDLFRWAGRDAVGYQELAENGYMLLAERARRVEDKLVVKEVIESVMKVRIDEETLYNLHRPEVETYIGCPVPSSPQIIWTRSMRRLFVLVSRALRFNEPILLVGETGSGKTSVCQLYAEVVSKALHTLSCHQNTETADLIGGLRPVRNRKAASSEAYRDAVSLLTRAGVTSPPTDVQGIIEQISVSLGTDLDPSLDAALRESQKTLVSESLFEWHDGPLIRAMRSGDVFLLDEISLADDSVLERLNSVLEPERTVVLAERGGTDGEYPVVHAIDSFKLLATMNPGGDYGKKELSPALRNRFTEIWVSPVDDHSDLRMIVENSWTHDSLKVFTTPLLLFTDWLRERIGDRSICTLRDLLAWVAFSNAIFTPGIENAMLAGEIFHHAAHMTFLDGLGSLPQTATYPLQTLQQIKDEAIRELYQLVPLDGRDASAFPYDPSQFVRFGPFALPRGPASATMHNFNLQAPTAHENALRVVRAYQVHKPILLEGSPGVGKTSLVAALAKIAGYHLCRINLSDQTDLIDLFGSDLPVENGAPGEFAWRDAEFLRALQQGHWVLLDEMNLAPQAILEGLNAVLDHRGTVYIPELGRSFVRHPSFRVFAAQNPLHQGGGRKGLPKSFLDRFTKVYVEELTPDDMLVICREQYREFDEHTLRAMIAFNVRLNNEVVDKRAFGREGSPWEFNLRDIIRWGELLRASNITNYPRHFIRIVYLSRFRNLQDRSCAQAIFDEAFSILDSPSVPNPYPIISSSHLQFGYYNTRRHNVTSPHRTSDVLQVHLAAVEAIGACLSRSWLVVVTGSRDSGKTNLIRALANLSGNYLDEVHVSTATDTTDLLGGFEQVDHLARVIVIAEEAVKLAEAIARCTCGITSRYRFRTVLQRELFSDERTPSSILQAVSGLLAELSMIDVEDTSLDAARRDLELKIRNLVQVRSTRGCFEWIDGPLIRAMKNGHWLLLDNANMCNPSVLDRLNSLCEPNGKLVLTERGFVDGEVQILVPDPNFRLLMTVDPQFGELSRAMRNRSVEVSLLTSFTEEDQCRMLVHSRLPVGPSTSYVSHEQARRGILTVHSSHDSSRASPSIAIDQDSISSALVVHTPFLEISDVQKSDALVHFAVRSFPESLHWIFKRYLRVSPPKGPLCSLFADRTFSELSKALSPRVKGVCHNVPHLLDDVLPMDDFMVYPPCPCCTERAEYCSYHALKLEILHFSASILLDRSDDTWWNSLKSSSNGAPAKCSPDLLGAVQSILAEIREFTQTLLEELLSGSPESHSDYNRAANLLSISRRLRHVLAQKNFDYSHIRVLSKLIYEALDKHLPKYQRLAHVSAILENTISPSSGVGLVEIWSQLRTVRPTEISSVDFQLLASLPTDVSGSVSRREQLEFLSVATLPMHLKPDNAERLLRISNQAKDLVSKVPREDRDLSWNCNPTSLLAELQILCDLHTENKPAIMQMLQRLIRIAVEEPDQDLRRFATYQHVIWNYDAECCVPSSTIAMATTQWLEALWYKYSDKGSTGPQFVFRSTQLLNSFEKSQIAGISLRSLDQHRESVKRHTRLTVLQCFTDISRLQQLAKLFNQSVLLVASCFSTSFDEHTLRRLHTISSDAGMEASKTLLDLLGKTNHVPLREAIRHLTAALHHDTEALSSLETSMFQLGRYWIALSRVVLDLFVPSVPIDPAAMIRHATLYAQDQANILKEQITFHSKLELRTAANKTNEVITYLDARANDFLNIPHASANIPTRDNVANLQDYWLEVSQFISQVINHSKIDELTRVLESRDPSALDREVVIQESISGFSHRIETRYTEFDDITCILRLAFAELRLGLCLTRCASEQPSLLKDARELVASLVVFPSTRCAHLLQVLPFPSTNLPAAELVILQVAAAVHCTQLPSTPMAVRTAYEQAYRLWSIDRAHDDRREQDLHSLYRSTTTMHNRLAEAEAEESEFLELFPTFEDSLHPSEVFEEKAHVSSKPTHHLTPDRQRQLLDLHLEFAGNVSDLPKADYTTSKFNSLRRSCLRSWIGTHSMTIPDLLDKPSLHIQLSVLREHLQDICSSSGSPPTSSNFYTDANIAEAKKASDVIRSLRYRLFAILRDWPDQMVIQHLIDRCDTILAFNFSTPIAKLLSALEQLLIQTEDWEMYANRDNSLKEHRHTLTTLIVEWRRLELACWKGLLESQSQSFVSGVAEFWFHLYEVLIRGPLNAAEETVDGHAGGLHGYLRQLPSLLDEFIRSSSLGQFQVRLDLLCSFEGFIHFMAPRESPVNREALFQVGRIVHSSWRYFHLFVPQLSTLLRDQRQALEREVEAFIKLASWKDVNVQALKQSAQKTHHHLYKLIRKFRDVLRQPVVDKMNPLFAGDAEGHHPVERELFPVQKSLSSAVTFDNVTSNSPSFPSHLGNLHQTLGKFNSFISDIIRPFLSSFTPEDVEQFSSDIIMTAKHLASYSIPPDLTKERREKYQKNLLLRKRKAWSDLLRELKRGGLSHSIKPEVLGKLMDESWIRDQPLIPANITMPSSQKAEHYFDRLRGCLPALRRVLSGHHSDLGTRELSRGISTVESGYSLALGGRSGLSEALSGYIALRQKADRLQVLSEHSETVAICADKIEPMYKALYHSVRALEELLEGMCVFSEIEPTTSAFPNVFEKCQTLAASGRVWRDHMFRVLQSCQAIMPGILLRDDYDVVMDAARYLDELPGRLEEMSIISPQLVYILQPTWTWIREQGHFSFSQLTHSLSESDFSSIDNVIDALLITVQSMLRRCSELPTLPEHTPESHQAKDNYIRLGLQTTSIFTALLDLPSLRDQLDTAITPLSSLPHSSRQQALKRVVPFLSCFLSFAGELLESLARWTSALFKLDYVVCSVVHTLGTQGFCIPPETEEGETAGNEKGNATELGGTGLGEGTGDQNVSKEIEDESQVEGLRGEDDDEEIQREKGKDEENTIEMSEDIGGEMEDTPGTEDDENEEAEGEEEEGPDEQMGKLEKSDPAAVDEKLWGDAEADDGENDQLQNDRSEEDQRKDTDVVAKESKKGKEKNDEKKAQSAKEGEQDEQKEDDDVSDEDTPEEMEPPNASGAQMDQQIPDADTLDLPDDMHLGEDQDKQDDHGEDDLEMEDVSDEEHVSDDQMTEDVGEDAGEERKKDRTPDDSMSVEPQDIEEQLFEAMDEDNANEENDQSDQEDQENSAVAQPDLAVGDGNAGASENEPQLKDGAQEGRQGSAFTQVETNATSGGEYSQDHEPRKQQSGDAAEHQVEPIPSSASDTQPPPLDPSSTAEGTHRGPAHAHQSHLAPSPNPLRTLGDVLNEVQQRFEEIFGSAEEAQPQPVIQHDDAAQVEYAPQDVSGDEDMQALGPAGEEQVAKLRELKLMDEENNRLDTDAMDIDTYDSLDAKQDPREAKDVAMERLEAEKTAERPAIDVMGAVVHTERDGRSHHQLDPSAPKAEDDIEPESETPSSELVINALTNHTSNPTPASASQLWSLYTTMTASLSLALCESLRLILAPTLATRLRGDFRSGKRLNMRRVVAWVASEYTKDRIWMRRVKPSGREYQVLLAVDDSASMRNGGSSGGSGGAIHLAYQTVVLVVQALGKLEVGEVGVARFGEGWELIRGFGSDATGAKDWGSSPTEGGRVLNAFTFSQSRTDVAAFLEGSLSVLEAAREGSSSTNGRELWQLEIIISDGICQDHEKLRRILRKAREMRVLVVFIIIDALNNAPSTSNRSGGGTISSSTSSENQSSILTLSQVSYKPSPTTGLMELAMERYLDSFPFEYYVVLRDVEALPRVLADTLREFFERINEE